MVDLGELIPVKPRKIWSDEAREFTPWLAENIHLLSQRLGLDLQVEDQESGVGDFRADIVASDSATRKPVVIENQLEETDHEHLGKILTYASGKEAAVSIWVSTKIRPEHQAALQWLNDVTGPDTAFFGLELEVLRIGNSPPAPNFKVVVQPNEWVKSQRSGREVSELHAAYGAFWTKMLEVLRERHPGITNARVGQKYNWQRLAVGKTGFSIQTRFAKDSVLQALLIIEYGERGYNEWAFASLANQREVIEEEIGGELLWDRLDEFQYSTIGFARSGSFDKAVDGWDDQAVWFADNAATLHRAFSPRVKELDYTAYEADKAEEDSEEAVVLSDS